MLESSAMRPFIDKTRYLEDFAGRTWEIDVFHGENEGLGVAEIELEGSSESRASALGREGSSADGSRIRNSSLSKNPGRRGRIADGHRCLEVLGHRLPYRGRDFGRLGHPHLPGTRRAADGLHGRAGSCARDRVPRLGASNALLERGLRSGAFRAIGRSTRRRSRSVRDAARTCGRTSSSSTR